MFIDLLDYEEEAKYANNPNALIDIVVERPGKPILCIEIKSSADVTVQSISSFKRITSDMQNAEAVVFSQDKYAKKLGDMLVMPWQEGLREYFV